MEKLTRRELLRYVGLATSASILAACQPKIVEVEKVVEKEVTKVVKEVVKETVIVEGTPQIVEREVTKIVKEIVEVEKEVTVAKPATGLAPTVRYLTDWYGGARGELMSMFFGWWAEERGDEATVAYEPCPSVGERLRVEFAAGTAPDLFLWSFVDTPELKHLLADMSPYYDVDPDIDEDDISPQHEVFYTGGKFALPMQGQYGGTSINLDLFEQAGLPMPWEHPDNGTGDKWWDWDDWREAAIAVGGLGPDIYGCGPLGGVCFGGQWSWMWSHGGDYIDLKNLKSTYASDPACLEVLERLHQVQCELTGVSIPADEYSSMRETLGMSPAAAGRVGMPNRMEEGHWAAAELNGHRVVTPRSPTTHKSCSCHNHQPNCMAKASEVKDAAWKLGVFLASYRCQLAIGVKGSSQPCRYSVIKSPDYLPDIPAVAKEALWDQVYGNSRFYHIFKGWTEWYHEWGPAMELVWHCEGDLKPILDEADEILTEVIQRYNDVAPDWA